MKIMLMASGGDGAGMNYCLWQLAKKLRKNQLYVCYEGLQGLIDNKIEKIDYGLIYKNRFEGGVIIRSSRSQEFMTEQGYQKAVENLEKNKIQKIIVLGGDGTYKAIQKLRKNASIVFIPATVDNDVSISEKAIGFESAVNNCLDYINNVRDTFISFNRTGIIEVMGRNDNFIANEVYKRSGADLLIVTKAQTDELPKKLLEVKKKVASPIVILRENLVNCYELAKYIEKQIKSEVRACVVGYFQRGGYPSKEEKIVADNFVNLAVANLLIEDIAVVYKNGAYKVIEI